MILKNKLEYLYIQNPTDISVIFVIFNVGAKDENDVPAGISHFLEHVLFLGSTTSMYSSNEKLYNAIDEIGGLINGMTHQYFTAYYIKVSNAYFYKAIEIIADMIQKPKFNSHDIERERKVVCEENNAIKTKPIKFAKELFDTHIFEGNPLSNSIGGNNDTLNKIHKEGMMDFYNKYYCPQNCSIVCVSKYNPKEKIEHEFGSWKSKCLDDSIYFKRPDYTCDLMKYSKCRIIKEIRHETSQDNIIIGFPLFGYTHKNKIIMDVLNIIIGGMLTSRLFTRLRHKERLVYSINSFTQYFTNCGYLMIITNVDNKNTSQVIDIIFEELNELKNKLISPEELHKVKKNIYGVMDIRNENTLNIAIFYAQTLLHNSDLNINKYLKAVDTVTQNDLQLMAKQFLNKNQALIIRVGKE